MTRALYFFLFSLMVGFFHGCAGVGQTYDESSAHIIQNVPFYQQEDFQCGPASLAGVLNYWAVNTTPAEISREIFSRSARGTLNIDMVLYPQKLGFSANQYRGSVEDLRKNIDLGYPVIVLVDYGFSLYQRNHFMVVVGYDSHGIIANSGKKERVFLRQEDFMKTWERGEFWTLVIKPARDQRN